MGKHPSSKRRHRKQKIKESYAKAREDAQLYGVIPTEPAGAVRDERVDPATQSDAPQVEIIKTAIRQGWAVPEEKKPNLVDELTKIVDDPEMPAKVKVAAFNALRMGDQQQYERDYPDKAAKAKGGTTVNNTNNVISTNVFNDIEILERGYKQIIGEDEADSEANSDIREDGDEESLDEEESDYTEEESETD